MLMQRRYGMVCEYHCMLASVLPYKSMALTGRFLAVSSQGSVGHAVEGGKNALQPGLQDPTVKAAMVDDSPSCGAKLPAASSGGADAVSGPGGYNLRKRGAKPIDAAKLVVAGSRKRARIAAKGSGGKGPVRAREEDRHQPAQDMCAAFALELAREMVAGMAPKTPDEVRGILSSLGVAATIVEHVWSHLSL